MAKRVGVIGYGIVGKAIRHVFSPFADEITIHDKYKDHSTLEETVERSNFLFLCVPTPFDFSRGCIDLGAMDQVVEDVAELASEGQICVIKSTVVPGTTKTYQERHPKLNMAMVPEFLREATYLQDAENPDRVILGACDEEVASKLRDLYRMRFPYTPIFSVSPSEAELLKYMSNCYLATKVMFGNLFYEYAEEIDGDYEHMKEALTADERITDDHLTVTDERGFGGKCFPKDLNALVGWARAQGLDARLLEEVWDKNLEVRQDRDWEEIPGASTEGPPPER